MAKKSENKTVATTREPSDFIASIEHDTRRADAKVLLEFIGDITGLSPRMWGTSIIGFGRYHYVYESGREGDSASVGFSPRKGNLVVYLPPGYEDLGEPLSRLGKHKIGKSCLYINKLADIDMSVLRELIELSMVTLAETYETFPE